jgi:RNA polymerase sigma-70 factor (ECF subfamily)
VRHSGEFQEFYEASYGRILAVIAAMTGDRHEAEDIVQEAFARALVRWSRLGGYDQPEAWVRRVALRIAIDSGRRRRRVAAMSARLSAQRQPPRPEPADALKFTALGAALLRLRVPEREVVVLHYVADLPVEAIARECRLPVGTVKTRLAAGRQHLHAELAKRPEAVA